MLPTIDKPTRIYRDSATLINNIFVNNLNDLVLSGNVITDLSDHFSQFCIMHSTLTKNRLHCSKIPDYSRYNEALFNNDILQIDWLALLAQASNDPNKQFLPPQGFGPEAKTRGGILGFPACIHIRNLKM